MKNGPDDEDKMINLSVGFLELANFHKLFDSIKQSLQKEQKELVLGRKDRQETDSYFNFMEFLFSSPDKVI